VDQVAGGLHEANLKATKRKRGCKGLRPAGKKRAAPQGGGYGPLKEGSNPILRGRTSRWT